MNLVLRAAVTPQRTGATAQTQAIAQATSQAQAFSAQSHPRGADGRFITTGGTVQILDSNGRPVAEGTVTAVSLTPQGSMIQVKNPTTGATITVPATSVKQAPIPIATLTKPGTQGIPSAPGAAARAGRYDALHGIKQRSGVDALGQHASPALLKAYHAAYVKEQAKVAKTALHKRIAAAKKRAAAAAKAAKKAGGSAYVAPKPVSTRSARSFYK